MRVLTLTPENRSLSLDALYASLASYVDLDLRRLSSEQITDLQNALSSIDFDSYDRTLIDLPFKRIFTQIDFIGSIPNLVLYDEDVCQNFIWSSKWFRKYEKFYRSLQRCRVISTGGMVSERLRDKGVDAVFVSKGYDQTLLSDLHRERDIPYGFVGRLNHKIYKKRRNLLYALARSKGLTLLRTYSTTEYRDILNRIRIFVSADIGFKEYMAKNFEAMACGCLLLAYEQGEEEKILGFKDMENVVLYRSKKEATQKIEYLDNNPALVEKIASSGRKLAEERFSLDKKGYEVYEALLPDIQARSGK